VSMPRAPIYIAPLLISLLLTAVPATVHAASAELTTSEGLQAVNGTELWVKRLGSGEPVVVVHGGPVLEHGYLLPERKVFKTQLAVGFE